MRILVSGAGIAGSASAFWLAKLGHEVTVVEHFDSLRTTGLQIDLRGHGVEVLRRMGLEESFRSKSVPEQGLQIINKTGRRRAFFPPNQAGKGVESFTTDFEIMRGDLCQLLHDATDNRVTYVFGTSVESYTEVEHGVMVKFVDGNTAQFDLWIGADGQNSRTRKMMLGPGVADGFHPLDGDFVAYFTIARPVEDGEEYLCTLYMATGRRSIMTRRSDPHRIQVYLTTSNTESERLRNARRGDVDEEKTAFAEIFADAGWQVDEILTAMRNADDFYCERLGIVKLDSWFKGHIVLVGDAAYCPSANTGMGTTSAIVGAYILAGEIGRQVSSNGGGLTAALLAYEAKFQPFMNQIQSGVLVKSIWDGITSTRFGVALVNHMMGLASFFGVNIFEYILKENVKGWDLSDYQELRV